jgi:hypothetical protein
MNFSEKELTKLDSLKTELARFLGSSKISATFYNNAINPADIYIQSNNLIAQKEQALRDLYVENDAISLLDRLRIPNHYASSSLLKILFLTGCAGLLAGLLLALLLEIRKKTTGLRE